MLFMKKFLFFLSAIVITLSSFAQSLERPKLVIENKKYAGIIHLHYLVREGII